MGRREALFLKILRANSVNRTKQTQLLIGLGLTALMGGTAVYLLDRPAEQSVIPSALSLFAQTPPVFGHLGASLPSFAHAFAFALLTAALLGGAKRSALTACLAWGLLETVFELGQHPGLATWLVGALPPVGTPNAFVDYTRAYFQHGTFDPGDLLAIAAGALAAYLVIEKTRPPASAS